MKAVDMVLQGIIECICIFIVTLILFEITIKKSILFVAIGLPFIWYIERFWLGVPEAIIPTYIVLFTMYYMAQYKTKWWRALFMSLAGFLGFVLFQHGFVAPIMKVCGIDRMNGIDWYVYATPLYLIPLYLVVKRKRHLFNKQRPAYISTYIILLIAICISAIYDLFL